jgi:hypothetical protein
MRHALGEIAIGEKAKWWTVLMIPIVSFFKLDSDFEDRSVLPSFVRDAISDFSQHPGNDTSIRSASRKAQNNLWKLWFYLKTSERIAYLPGLSNPQKSNF